LVTEAYITIRQGSKVLTTTAYIILAFTIMMELYYRGTARRPEDEQTSVIPANLVAREAAATTPFLNDIETITLTKTITKVIPTTVTKTKRATIMDRFSQADTPSTCVCVLTGAWNTRTAEQTSS